VDRKLLRNKRIGVLMGGTSPEREVSLRSGMAVYKALKSRRYDVVSVDVGNDLCAVLGKEKIEMAFIVLHGGHGENGAVQGLLEVMDIPYTGSGVLASALAMDKEASKKVFLYHGIPVPPFTVFHKTEKDIERGQSDACFDMPWVVKPVSQGSSVGVEIVKKKADLGYALDKAFSYGENVIIEKYIKGKEVQIGILNGKVLGGVEVRPSLEFYNYEAKYTPGLTKYIFPPQITKKAYERARETALAANAALGCGGATRVDLIIDRYGRSFVLEVNTIPGMTETSLLPKIAREAGLDFPELLEEILGGTCNEG
jgi:D-alanine-D-alanine ligase